MRTIVIDDPVAWESVLVNLTVTRATVLTHLSDGTTSMTPLLYY